jgi:GNAT superfamily N-acetyltransferase
MKLIEVKDKSAVKEFLHLPVRLYKDEKNWIRPLDKDIEAVFDPKKNKYFRHGECIRWILQNGQGETIGRVAAFINRKTSTREDQPTGGLGFFECINEQEAAFVLFDCCKEWLQEKGMEAMDGPINFGDRDRWWGALARGYDREPNYCMPYNFPYYIELFEAYGFKEYFQQFTYGRPVAEEGDTGISEKVYAKAERLRREPRYVFRQMNKKNIGKYAEDFRTIYNKAWVKHKGVGEMSKAQAENVFKQLKPVIDENILWFGYYDGEPIAFFLNLPEVNQIFKHVDGRLDLAGKLKFLYYKHIAKIKKMFGVVFGVVPEHQGKGVEAAIVLAIADYVWSSKSQYEYFEMNWIGDFNPKMIKVATDVGGKVVKVHHTYRFLFDRNKEFKRAPVIE